jgi:hypothetical protein
LKVRAYLRVAKTIGRKGYKVVATTVPSDGSLLDSSGGVLPTVGFAVDFILPDELFKRAEQVIAEVEVPVDSASISAVVRELRP